MLYGKLIDNKLVYAPNPIKADGKDIFTTDPTPYGYKPVIRTEQPQQEGYYASFTGWEETDTEIIQKWELIPIPEPPASDEDYENALEEVGVQL